MITLNGKVEFAAAARRARNAMLNQDNIAKFLPPGSTIAKLDDQSFEFEVVKDVGITTVHLAGHMQVTPTDQKDTLRFVADAKHALGGNAVIDLAIRFDGDADNCAMIYEGTMQASGLVGKFLALGANKVQIRLDQAFREFGARLEKSQRNAAQAESQA